MNFKKYGIAIAATSFLLTGCGSNSKTVKDNGKYVLASLTDKKIYADDVFNKVSETADGKSAYFDAVLQKLVDTNFPIDDAMKTDAELKVTQLKNYYANQYGAQADAQLKMVLQTNNFSDIDAYQESLTKALQYSTFLKKYVNDNFDVVFDDYYNVAKPRMISIVAISVANVAAPTQEETAKINEVTALVNSGTDFSEIATQHSSDSSKSMGGNLGIVDTTTGLTNTYGADVETAALALKSGEVSPAIKGGAGYYFLKCTSDDKETIKAKLKDVSVASPLISYDKYLQYLAFQSYKITYNDEGIKKIIDDTITMQLKARETTRGGNQ